MDNLIGKRLDGRYSIESLVGVGGMANVYRGTDLKTGNQIAVKVLKDEFLDNEELVRRFKNESKPGDGCQLAVLLQSAAARPGQPRRAHR